MCNKIPTPDDGEGTPNARERSYIQYEFEIKTDTFVPWKYAFANNILRRTIVFYCITAVILSRPKFAVNKNKKREKNTSDLSITK